MRRIMVLGCLLLAAPVARVARAADWVADPAASKLEFSGAQFGQPFRGAFHSFTARISFDPAQPQAAVADVTVDLSSALTGDRERDTALPTPEWFDAKKHPQAIFHAASFTPKGADAFEAKGKLTVRGVSADVTVPFTLKIEGQTAHAKGHADLLRSTFGVGQGQFADDQVVAFQVGVDVDLVARKAP